MSGVVDVGGGESRGGECRTIIAGTLSDPDYQNFPNYLNDLTLLLGSMYFWTPRKCTLLTKMVNLTKTITNSSAETFWGKTAQQSNWTPSAGLIV